MPMMRLRVAIVIGCVALATGAACVGLALRASLPDYDGSVQSAHVSAPASAEFDSAGIVRISAHTRADAFFTLGFVTARERLFQMDLARRQMAGRLAEVFGEGLAESDRWHRTMDFADVARRIWQGLPHDQQAVLQAYADGVNEGIASLAVRPAEFLLLGYKPAQWRPEDSLLVILGIEEALGWSGDIERMATVTASALPPSVYQFLTPSTDRYTDRLLGLSKPKPNLPIAELAALLGKSKREKHAGLVADAPPPIGSNAWVVGPGKTSGGRAILANDMHLELRVPNVWYRAELAYGDVHIGGLTLPGVPLVVSGSNGQVAWGFTNIGGDFVDLVALELDADDPSRYRTPQGFVSFGERAETVNIKGAETPQTLKVRTTIWGPVLPQPVAGHWVAVRWTALDPKATDLALLHLDEAKTVAAALDIFNTAGGPPLNALAADGLGNIGWTLMGRLPKRFGLDGSVSLSWADGAKGWDGYIPPAKLPRRVNPKEGYIVSANQRMVGDYGYPIGSQFPNGFRAHRIAERLAAMQGISERDMLALQLDTRVEFYRYYQRLALSLLEPGDDRLRGDLEAWDGSAQTGSRGLATLLEFRRLLLDAVLSPFLQDCLRLAPDFHFSWLEIDEPLQSLLEARPPELLPDPEHHRDWRHFLHDVLTQAGRNVAARSTSGADSWGDSNKVAIAHPFSAALPFLQAWLDMPAVPVAGCPICVRVWQPGIGASERLAVAPGHERSGILHMPGGQSGHPLSPHYHDQQPAWVDGTALPFLAGPAAHRLEFLPKRNPVD